MAFKPDNMPQLSVYLIVEDVERSIKFYKEAFGFEVEFKADDPKNTHVEMRKGDALIMFCQKGAFGNTKNTPLEQKAATPMTIHIYTEDTDKLFGTATKCGAKVVMEPHDSFWGDRFCSLTDLDGYEWGFGTKLAEKD